MKISDTKIVVPCVEYYKFVNIADIIRCQAMQNYTRIFLKNEKPLISSHNIGVYINLLDSEQFFNCHKSHLINTKLINRYFKDGYIEMCDNSTVPVARRRKNSFLEKVIMGSLPKRKETVIYLDTNDLSKVNSMS